MIFSGDLCDKVLAGEKTVTRRVVSPNPQSPWARTPGPQVGKDYAVQPGRGQRAVGRIKVTHAAIAPLGWLRDQEAQAEGFLNARDFEARWRELHGGKYDPMTEVWVVEFRLVEGAA